MRVIGWAAATLICLASAPGTQAHEPLFGYVYTTDLLPQGKFELEHWSTLRSGKSRGSYNFLQNRSEIEYGVTNNFQASFYVNTDYVNAKGNNVDGTTGGAGVPDNANPNGRYERYKFDTVSFEGIYRVLSPYIDPIGLALYVEPSIGPQRKELETKLLLQKNFLDDTLIWAGNITLAWEWEHSTGNPSADPATDDFRPRWEHNMELEFTTGLSYRVAPGWFAGVEFRNHREFSAHNFSKAEHSAYFLGPNIHYGAERWFFTLTVLPQLPFAEAYTDEQKQVIRGGRIFGNEHEQVELRLKAGFVF